MLNQGTRTMHQPKFRMSTKRVLFGAASVAEAEVSADAAAGGDPLQVQCPTDWIELETYSAAFYDFSPDGADEGPSWSSEPPSFFIRCREDGRTVVWVGKPGTTPPGV
jgi:hypothetical protein